MDPQPSLALWRNLDGKEQDPHLVVYCDESGNSGPNLLDFAQPVYVLGGWVVPASHAASVEQVAQNTVAELAPASTELHGARLLRTRRGQAALEGFMLNMGKAGAWPVYEIVEKRYWIAGKIVETFLDPSWNTSSSWEFYNDIERKQGLANDLSQLPDDYLHEFALAYRSLDPDRLERCAKRLSTLYALKGERGLAKALDDCSDGLPQITAAERQANSRLPSNALASVNLPVLVSFLSLVEDMARDLHVGTVRIVHDESKEFAQAYQWAFALYQNAKPGVDLYLPNGRLFAFRFEKVSAFDMVKSHECPLVQAADFLVAGLYAYARSVARGETPAEWLLRSLELVVASAILPAYAPMPTFGHLMGSPTFLVNMFRHLPSFRGGSSGAGVP